MITRNRIPGEPVFLIGAQRSGTTALGVALSTIVASKGGIFTVNGKLLYYLCRWWLDDNASRHARADEVIYALARRRPFGEGIDDWLIRASRALKKSAQFIAESGGQVEPVEEMRSICISAYANADLWGDKYNEYLLHLGFLNKLFPRATYIFLARDPSHSAASMMGWTGDRPWNPETFDSCLSKWTYWNKQWLAFRETIDKERRIELLYDNFGINSIQNLSELFDLDVTPYFRNYYPRTTGRYTKVYLPCPTIEVWNAIQSFAIQDNIHSRR